MIKSWECSAWNYLHPHHQSLDSGEVEMRFDVFNLLDGAVSEFVKVKSELGWESPDRSCIFQDVI